MPEPPQGELTSLLQAWQHGDESARDSLIPVVYRELRKRAAGHLRRERRGHTLRPTDLVHETYLRLCAQNSAWQNRGQFFGVPSRLMRRILVDHARARGAAKRVAVCVSRSWIRRPPRPRPTPTSSIWTSPSTSSPPSTNARPAWSSFASAAASAWRRRPRPSACRTPPRAASGRPQRLGSIAG